jgi:hypothetical protein
MWKRWSSSSKRLSNQIEESDKDEEEKEPVLKRFKGEKDMTSFSNFNVEQFST